MKDFNSYVHWAFQGILAAAVVYGTSILADMNKSIQTLNVHTAVIFEKVTNHDKDIYRIDAEIKDLKRGK